MRAALLGMVLDIITRAGAAGMLGAAATAAMLELARTLLFPEEQPPALFVLIHQRLTRLDY